MSAIESNKWKHKSTKVFPVDIASQPANTRVMVEMPKPFPADFLPIYDIKMKTIKSKLNQYDPCYVEPHQINAQREVTQRQIELRSKKFPNSNFTIDVPFNFISRESGKTFFTLLIQGERVKMEPVCGILTCDQWILDKNGVSLSFKQLMKFQQIMTDTRKRYKPTQEDIFDMFDEDGQFRDASD